MFENPSYFCLSHEKKFIIRTFITIQSILFLYHIQYDVVPSGRFIIIVTYLVNLFVVKPKRLKTQYVRLLKEQGFKVLEMPLMPVSTPYYTQFIAAFKEKKESFFYFRN